MARSGAYFFSWNDYTGNISSSLASDAISDTNRRVSKHIWHIVKTDIHCILYGYCFYHLPWYHILYDEISNDKAISVDGGLEPYAKSL